MKTQTVHFTVDPDGITRLIRDMWAEGSYEKALNVLGSMACGVVIPQGIQYDIIRGKKKFANYNGDPDQFCIIVDNWKPRDGDYPDPEPSKLAAFLKKRADEEFKVEATTTGFDFTAMKRFGGYDTIEQMNQALLIQRNISKIDPLADMHSREERERNGKPKPDTELESKAGWILPNGKFYACLTAMEHVWLASQFGKTEKQAEDAGWIKINHGLLNDTNILHFKPPTQKQLNTLFDWCEKHKVSMPEWATE